MTKKSQPKAKSPTLRHALSDVDDLGKNIASKKDLVIVIRVSIEEKERIRDVAGHLGLSVSAYLLDLHRLASERLGY
tara:strand:- start:1752 stop:1982 length:231 start_codon:yes stop_codon:yes gene_type:complete